LANDKKFIYSITPVKVVRHLNSGSEDKGFESRADQISQRCQQLATAAKLMCGPWRKEAKMGTVQL